MSLTLPTPWVAGEKIKPSRLNGFMTPIQSKFASGIRSDDLASDAGVKGSQISSGSGTRITNANLETNAVDNRALKSDVAAGHAGAAVDSDHIRSGAIDSDHFAAGAVNAAALGALAATKAKLNLTTYSHAAAISSIAAGTTSNVNTGLSTATTLPVTLYLLTIADMQLSLFQSAGTWWVAVSNVRAAGPVTVPTNDLKVVYVS